VLLHAGPVDLAISGERGHQRDEHLAEGIVRRRHELQGIALAGAARDGLLSSRADLRREDRRVDRLAPRAAGKSAPGHSDFDSESMQTELDIPENSRDNGCWLEEDLLPVEPQHDEPEARERGIPPKVPKPLFATAVVLLTVALDDQSIADKEVYPVEIREGDAHLGCRRASRLSKKHPDHAFRPRISAIIDQRKKRTPRSG
jgi:hypothetical protein